MKKVILIASTILMGLNTAEAVKLGADTAQAYAKADWAHNKGDKKNVRNQIILAAELNYLEPISKIVAKVKGGYRLPKDTLKVYAWGTEDKNPLTLAVSHNNEQMVKDLLQLGAEVNPPLNAPISPEMWPLKEAILQKSLSMIQLLLGAKRTLVSDQDIALAEKLNRKDPGYQEILNLLLSVPARTIRSR